MDPVAQPHKIDLQSNTHGKYHTPTLVVIPWVLVSY